MDLSKNTNTIKSRKLQKRRKDNNQCVNCGNYSENYYCDKCQKNKTEYHRRWREKKKLNGERISNGSNWKKSNRMDWKDKGLCVECGKETLKNKSYCENHLIKKVALKQLGSSKYSKQLKQLLIDQDYKCALTGRLISLNDEIEIDHIIPISRGGTKTMNNVRWVIKDANRLKGYFLDEEIMPIIEDILTFQNRPIHLNP